MTRTAETRTAEEITASDPTRILRGGRPEGGAAAARVEALYAEHRTTVLAVCRGLLRDHVEAEDAAQQTFLSAQRALANGSVPRDPVAWLVTIARNECIARVRGRMRDPLPTADEPNGVGPDAHAAAVSREEVGHLRDALASLPAQQRDAILLRELRGLSYDEVAASLAVSTSAVESLLFRARRGLQLRLREVAASLSPVGWIGPLRDLGARLIGGGAAAPFAAKAVVVGLGTAVVAGGVVEAPRVIGLGHARHLSHATSTAARQAIPSTPLVFAAVGTGSGGSASGSSGRDFTHMFAASGDGEGGSGQGADRQGGHESEDSQFAPTTFSSGEDGSHGSTSHEGRDGGGSGRESGDGQTSQGTQLNGGGESGDGQTQSQQVSPSQDGQSDDGQSQGTQYGSVLTATPTGQTSQGTVGTTTPTVTTVDGGGTGTTTGDG